MQKELTMEEMLMVEEEEEGARWWELCTVFAGSEAGDVEVARALWRSACLEPALESRLVSADIRQRLRVADSERGPPGSCTQAPLATDTKEQDISMKTRLKEKMDERARYEKCAKRRQEILALLQKQREERMKKELVALPYKPK